MTPPELINLTELAALRGVGKAAMSERVARYELDGRLTTVKDGRAKMIRLAEFEAAEAATVNLSKMAGAATKRAKALNSEAPAAAIIPAMMDEPPDVQDMPPRPTGGYTKAQADLAEYRAQIAKLDLDQRLGKVVPVADVTEAMARCAEALVRGIEQLPASADDIAAAVAKNGASGARAALKAKARDLRELLAREMKLLGAPAETAAETDSA